MSQCVNSQCTFELPNVIRTPKVSQAIRTPKPATISFRKRSADLMAWCKRCAVGIHFHCANDHALEHAEEDCIGNYRANAIAAKSGLCHDCWSTYEPYVDESDEDEIDADTNPERLFLRHAAGC